MSRARLFATLVCGFALLAPASALGQVTAEVDQVLAALAEVVRDRAKRVAAATIAREIKDQICSKELKLYTRGKDRKKEAEPRLKLRLGGSKECAEGTADCSADDVFVETCRLSSGTPSGLTDPHFLKTMTQETVALLMRISASRLDAERYARLRFPAFAEYVHKVMEIMTSRPKTPGPFAPPTFVLADALNPGLEHDVMTALGGSVATQALIDALRPKITGACPPESRDPECASLTAKPVLWYPQVPADPKERKTACDAWFDVATERQAVFTALFGKDASGKDNLFTSVKDKSCSELRDEKGKRAPPAEVKRCERAQLLVNLTDVLYKSTCFPSSPNPRRELRELRHVLSERGRYEVSLANLGIEGKLEAFSAEFEKVSLEKLPRQALAAGVRVFAAFLRAYGADPMLTKGWLRQLGVDAQNSVEGSGDPFTLLAKGAALTHANRENLGVPELVVLRDAVADLIALPGLYVQRANLTNRMLHVRSALIAMFEQLSVLAVEEPSFSGAVHMVAEYLDAVARLTDELSDDPDEQVVESLKAASAIFRVASQGDWVGVGGLLVDQLSEKFAKDTAAGRPISFVRVLLAMYQADSVPEAKKVFEAALEDEAAREQRFDNPLTVDVAALVAARFGAAQDRDQIGKTDPSGLYGMYAPFGVQLAWTGWLDLHHGAIVYPLDLGTYLTGQMGSDQSPRWSDAVRFGAAWYLRPSGRIPIVLGLGADFQPRFERPANARAQAFIALELPLMLMY